MTKGVVLDERGMQALARRLAGRIETPLVIYLEGDLGAGKTTFCRALIQGLGYSGQVKSPTYGLLELYSVPDAEVLHLDLYRLEQAGEMEVLGVPDLIDSDTLLLVEWPEKGGRFVPPEDVVIILEHTRDARRIRWEAHSDSGKSVCRSLAELVQQAF